MKRIIMFVLLFAALKVAGQTTGYLRFDTVKIMKQNGTCELYVINKTKDSLGLLTNVGSGLTQFIKPKVLNDSAIVVGLDTLIIRGTGGGSATLSNVGSGYRLVKTSDGQVKTVFVGYGLDADSTTNTDAITFKADTSELVTPSDLIDAVAGAVVESEHSVTGDGSTGSKLKLVNDASTPGTHKVYGTDASGVKGYQQGVIVELTSPTDGQILEYNSAGTKWVNVDNTAVPETQIKFRVAIDPAMAAGDSVYTDAALQGKLVKVYREGERMYPDTVYGISVDTSTGSVTFHPYLSAGEKIIIETSNYITSNPVALEDLDFPTAVSLTNAGTTWSSTTGTMFGAYGLSNKKLAAGDDGYIQARYTASDGGGAILAFNTSNTNEQYADNPPAPTVYNYEAGAFLISGVGTLYYLDAGVSSGAPISTGVTLSTGDYFRIIRTGSSLELQSSVDGSSWTNRHTYTFSSAADLFINCNINDPNKLYEPKGFGIQ